MQGEPGCPSNTNPERSLLEFLQDNEAFSKSWMRSNRCLLRSGMVAGCRWYSGRLFFGASTIYPGKVGNEYFMTKGHFHSQSDRAEFYWGVQGKGMLILMDRNRKYLGGRSLPRKFALHRRRNCSPVSQYRRRKLIVGACWPSDAGHDYDEIAKNGFSARLVELEGLPKLV
jgi:glucose-6-phosphate isomerase, archaeal